MFIFFNNCNLPLKHQMPDGCHDFLSNLCNAKSMTKRYVQKQNIKVLDSRPSELDIVE